MATRGNPAWKKGMARVPGSGQKPGTRTKRSLETQEIYERIVEKYGEPMLALAEMSFDPQYDPAIRQSSLKELVSYGHAKKRVVEVTGPDGGALEIDVRLSLIEQITTAINTLGGK